MIDDKAKEATPKEATPKEATPKSEPLPPGHGNFSINEPPGSNVGGVTEPPVPDPLVLSDISPDTYVAGSGSFLLTATGSGFTAECVVVFNDVDAPTTYVSATELTADCPVEGVAGVVDVEVSRGEDLSDVLTFEFTAVTGMARKTEKKVMPSKGKKGKR